MLDFLESLTTARSALFLDGWLRFNEEKWGYRSERVLFRRPENEFPKLEGVFYLDKKGHVVMPPRNPYLPLQFIPSPTEQPYRLYTQWLEVAEMLAHDISKRGFRGTLAFPPGFIDGRVLQWQGQTLSMRYTFLVDLSNDDKNIDSSVRNKIKKAMRENYIPLPSNDWYAINSCLSKVEDVKNFSHNISTEDLFALEKLLGKDAFRGYLCSSPDGEPVAGQIKIFLAGGVSIDWSAGTDRDHIKNGVNQLLYRKSCDDMTNSGGKYFDLCGANIRPVAEAKAAWGWPLTPYLTLCHDDLAHRLFRTCVPSPLRSFLKKTLRG